MALLSLTPTTRTILWFGALAIGSIWLVDGNLDALRARIEPPREGEPSLSAPGLSGAPGGGAPRMEAEVPPLPPAHAAAQPGTPAPPFAGQPVDDPCVAHDGDRCTEHALDRFYRAAFRVHHKQPGALLRVAHVGDSVVADDKVTARVRQRLQAEYGDGGAGFLYVFPPSRWYHVESADLSATGWVVQSIVWNGGPDGLYGLGGASFSSEGAGRSTFGTVKKGSGDRVSHYDVYYLAQPHGGTLEVSVDGKVEATIDTGAGADLPHAAFHAVDVPDGAHKLALRSTNGKVRTFGVVMERATGVVVDNLGLISNTAKTLAKITPAHWQEQIAHRGANLVIVLIGTNEADRGPVSKRWLGEYEQILGGVLATVRASGEGTSCLVMAPLDAATIDDDGKVEDKPAIPGLVEAQRRAAAASGCAFWDSYAWMGGKGAIRKWHDKGWAEPDLTHPTAAGGARLADAVVDALLAGYDDWARQGHAP